MTTGSRWPSSWQWRLRPERSRSRPGWAARKASSSGDEPWRGRGVWFSFTLPVHAQHQAVEPAADAQEGHTVAGPQDLTILGQGRGQGKRYRADVAEVGECRIILVDRDTQ